MPQLCLSILTMMLHVCMVVFEPWTWLQLVCSPRGRVALCLPWLLPDHMHMAAGLGMLGSPTCVRLLSTVSKTGAIMEKSVPGELSSWLDLRRRTCSQNVQCMQKGERRTASSTNADTFGLHGMIPFPGSRERHADSSGGVCSSGGQPEWVGWQRRAGLIPHPVPQHGCALLHHARHAVRLLHLIARPARRLLGTTAKVALHRRATSLMGLCIAVRRPHSCLASVRTHARPIIPLLRLFGCPALPCPSSTQVCRCTFADQKCCLCDTTGAVCPAAPP